MSSITPRCANSGWSSMCSRGSRFPNCRTSCVSVANPCASPAPSRATMPIRSSPIVRWYPSRFSILWSMLATTPSRSASPAAARTSHRTPAYRSIAPRSPRACSHAARAASPNSTIVRPRDNACHPPETSTTCGTGANNTFMRRWYRMPPQAMRTSGARLRSAFVMGEDQSMARIGGNRHRQETRGRTTTRAWLVLACLASAAMASVSCHGQDSKATDLNAESTAALPERVWEVLPPPSSSFKVVFRWLNPVGVSGNGRAVWQQSDGWRRLDFISSINAPLGSFSEAMPDDRGFALGDEAVSCVWSAGHAPVGSVVVDCGYGSGSGAENALTIAHQLPLRNRLSPRTILNRDAECFAYGGPVAAAEPGQLCVERGTHIPLYFSGRRAASGELVTLEALGVSDAPPDFLASSELTDLGSYVNVTLALDAVRVPPELGVTVGP